MPYLAEISQFPAYLVIMAIDNANNEKMREEIS
jgi:hypothetical protein